MTYNGNIATSDLDAVRFMIGDTSNNPATELFPDAVILSVLTVQPIPVYAAAALADALAAKYSASADVRIGQTSVSSSQLADKYAKLATMLRSGPAGRLPGGDGTALIAATMAVGGITKAQVEAERTDTGAIQPSFSVGMDDDPGTNPSDQYPWRW